MRRWSAEEVKRERPDVEVLLLGRKHAARCSAASHRIATVTILGGPRGNEQYEFPWDMIAWHLERGTPLQPLR